MFGKKKLKCNIPYTIRCKKCNELSKFEDADFTHDFNLRVFYKCENCNYEDCNITHIKFI